eukprot:GHVN01090038.1.p1 GENE.GHVN01090038.1~~GHVN01090038.1.p1  ORF type:complete len:491 (+),score=94.35 GHVN01090038.1:77-1474(+)
MAAPQDAGAYYGEIAHSDGGHYRSSIENFELSQAVGEVIGEHSQEFDSQDYHPQYADDLPNAHYGHDQPVQGGNEMDSDTDLPDEVDLLAPQATDHLSHTKMDFPPRYEAPSTEGDHAVEPAAIADSIATGVGEELWAAGHSSGPTEASEHVYFDQNAADSHPGGTHLRDATAAQPGNELGHLDYQVLPMTDEQSTELAHEAIGLAEEADSLVDGAPTSAPVAAPQTGGFGEVRDETEEHRRRKEEKRRKKEEKKAHKKDKHRDKEKKDGEKHRDKKRSRDKSIEQSRPSSVQGPVPEPAAQVTTITGEQMDEIAADAYLDPLPFDDEAATDPPLRDESEILEKSTMKQPKKKRKTHENISPEEVEQHVQMNLTLMKSAAETDKHNFQNSLQATAKLQLVNQLVEEISQPKFARWYLRNKVLDVLALWLEPLQESPLVLPNVTIRRKLLRLMEKLPVREILVCVH